MGFKKRLAVSLVWLGLAPVAVFAQAPAAVTPPQNVAVAPIDCWWKTDRSAIRVGEQFSLTLTCAVVDTELVKVVVDESGLAPGSLHLVPFEIVGGQRFRDIVNGPRRFFQYEYTMRVLGEEFFGKEITLPRLQLSYRVQNSLAGGSAATGREQQYSLREVPIRVLSLVPAGATEIRDTPPDTFGDVDSRLFRSNLLLIAAGVALVLAGLIAVVALARTAIRRRAAVATRHRVVSIGAVLRAASSELTRVRKATEQNGWSGDLIARAAAALRLAGAVALSRPISQREVDRDTQPSEGQIVIGRGIRGKKFVLSAGITPGSVMAKTSRNGASPLWGGISQSIGVFTVAHYSRSGTMDGTALTGALAEGQNLVKRLRLHEWRRLGRRKPPAASEHGIQTWVR